MFDESEISPENVAVWAESKEKVVADLVTKWLIDAALDNVNLLRQQQAKWRDVPELASAFARAVIEVAEWMRLNDREAEASTHLREVTGLCSVPSADKAKAYATLASIESWAGHWQKAVDCLQQARETAPEGSPMLEIVLRMHDELDGHLKLLRETRWFEQRQIDTADTGVVGHRITEAAVAIPDLEARALWLIESGMKVDKQERLLSSSICFEAAARLMPAGHIIRGKALMCLAQTLGELKVLPECLRIARVTFEESAQWLGFDEMRAEAEFGLGSALAATGDTNEATKVFERVAADPHALPHYKHGAMNNLATLAMLSGNGAKGRALWALILQDPSAHPGVRCEARVSLGIFYRVCTRFLDAVDCWTRVIEYVPPPGEDIDPFAAQQKLKASALTLELAEASPSQWLKAELELERRMQSSDPAVRADARILSGILHILKGKNPEFDRGSDVWRGVMMQARAPANARLRAFRLLRLHNPDSPAAPPSGPLLERASETQVSWIIRVCDEALGFSPPVELEAEALFFRAIAYAKQKDKREYQSYEQIIALSTCPPDIRARAMINKATMDYEINPLNDWREQFMRARQIPGISLQVQRHIDGRLRL